ncbi:MAG: hypothetical protein ABIR33_02395 [Pyrinomonadaceae bacterium]
MSTDQQDDLTKLEEEFLQEPQGEGSLVPKVDGNHVGFDIHPEDIDALFFDGIGVPRYASIEIEDLDEHNAVYMERYNAAMAKFPLIGRANDTMVGANYSRDEIAGLLAECHALIESSTDPKATRATKKLLISAMKAEEKIAPLKLSPRM